MEHWEQTVADMQAKVLDMEKATADIKVTVNKLCALYGKPPLYADTAMPSESGSTYLRKDTYHGKHLATAVTMYLAGRKHLGAATIDEIYAALAEGGFEFVGKDAATKQRGLAISLGKNSKFHRVPGGSWGLVDWYEGVRTRKATTEPNGEFFPPAGSKVAEENAGEAEEQKEGEPTPEQKKE
jgi:hypothetical protein